MNCLQVMVERSRTTALAGTDDSANAAANSIETTVFILNLPLARVTPQYEPFFGSLHSAALRSDVVNEI
jgi:hypothetical protein